MIRLRLANLVLPLAMVAGISAVLAPGCSNPTTQEDGNAISAPSAQRCASIDAWRSFSAKPLGVDFSQLEVVVESHSPEHYAHLRGEGPDFRDRGNMTFHSPIVAYDELTDAEKMALYGLVTKDRLSTCNLADFAMSILNFYIEHGRNPQGPWELPSFEREILHERASELSFDQKRWWASPITGKAFDFTKTQFSPGNAYMQVVTDPDIVAYYDRHHGSLLPDPGKRYLLYIRLYGLNAIIAEGIETWHLQT